MGLGPGHLSHPTPKSPFQNPQVTSRTLKSPPEPPSHLSVKIFGRLRRLRCTKNTVFALKISKFSAGGAGRYPKNEVFALENSTKISKKILGGSAALSPKMKRFTSENHREISKFSGRFRRPDPRITSQNPQVTFWPAKPA